MLSENTSKCYYKIGDGSNTSKCSHQSREIMKITEKVVPKFVCRVFYVAVTTGEKRNTSIGATLNKSQDRTDFELPGNTVGIADIATCIPKIWTGSVPSQWLRRTIISVFPQKLTQKWFIISPSKNKLLRHSSLGIPRSNGSWLPCTVASTVTSIFAMREKACGFGPQLVCGW